MRRAPARPVRACFVRTCCTAVVQGHYLRATTTQRNAKQTLSSHFTLPSSHFALHASHLHFALRSSPHLKSSDFFSPHATSSQLILAHPIFPNMSTAAFLFRPCSMSRFWSRDLELQNFKQLHTTTTTVNCSSKTRSRRRDKKRRFWITLARYMQVARRWRAVQSCLAGIHVAVSFKTSQQ